MQILSKTTKNLSLGCLSLGRDLNPGPPEYEAEVLTSRPEQAMAFYAVDLTEA
jgi:hypothetical protein